MSAPKRVTVDDPITRILPNSVVLEVVETVNRQGFSTIDFGGSLLKHEDEGAMWLRGHHLLGSDEAKAAQAAYALIVSAPATQSPGSAVTASMYPNPMTSYVGSMVSGGVPFIGGFSTGTKR